MTGPSQAKAGIWRKGEEQPGDPQIRREQAQREGGSGDQEADCRNERVGAGARRAEPVAEPAAEPNSRHAADQYDRAIEPADISMSARPKLRAKKLGSQKISP